MRGFTEADQQAVADSVEKASYSNRLGLGSKRSTDTVAAPATAAVDVVKQKLSARSSQSSASRTDGAFQYLVHLHKSSILYSIPVGSAAVRPRILHVFLPWGCAALITCSICEFHVKSISSPVDGTVEGIQSVRCALILSKCAIARAPVLLFRM